MLVFAVATDRVHKNPPAKLRSRYEETQRTGHSAYKTVI